MPTGQQMDRDGALGALQHLPGHCVLHGRDLGRPRLWCRQLWGQVPFCFIYPFILVYLLCQTCRLSANLRKNTQLLSDLRRGHVQGGGYMHVRKT